MERFEFVSNLGEGSYGLVWKCRDRTNGQILAMKRFKEAHNDEHAMRLASRELLLLKQCSHPNIIKLVEAFRSKSGRVYAVLEFAESTLTEELQLNPHGFHPDLLKIVMWQLLEATVYMHTMGIMHRDLKPANILLNPDSTVKLCDFGFARTMSSPGQAPYTGYVVTRWYRPPEILVGDAYGPSVDVWALGCLFAEMASGSPLFPGRNSLDQLWHIVRTVGPLTRRQDILLACKPDMHSLKVSSAHELCGIRERFPTFHWGMLQILQGCLDPDPEQRLSASQLMQLPYFLDIELVKARFASRPSKLNAESIPLSPGRSLTSPPHEPPHPLRRGSAGFTTDMQAGVSLVASHSSRACPHQSGAGSACTASATRQGDGSTGVKKAGGVASSADGAGVAASSSRNALSLLLSQAASKGEAAPRLVPYPGKTRQKQLGTATEKVCSVVDIGTRKTVPSSTPLLSTAPSPSSGLVFSFSSELYALKEVPSSKQPPEMGIYSADVAKPPPQDVPEAAVHRFSSYIRRRAAALASGVRLPYNEDSTAERRSSCDDKFQSTLSSRKPSKLSNAFGLLSSKIDGMFPSSRRWSWDAPARST